MYISYNTWLDIAFVIKQLSKSNANSRIGYVKRAKRIIQYLKGTLHLKLTFGAHLKPEE